MLGDTEGFWWDRLGALLRSRPDGPGEFPLEVGGTSRAIPVGGGDLPSEFRTIRSQLLPLSVAEIERILDGVGKRWSVSSAAPPDALPLTPEELRRLAAEESVAIGAHTVDHVRLQGRPHDEQRATIVDSHAELEDLLGRPVAHFAYPFGRRDDFDDATVDAVRQAGFDTACTTLAGSAGPSVDRYRLPRRLVMDWGRMRFRAQLQRWKLG